MSDFIRPIFQSVTTYEATLTVAEVEAYSKIMPFPSMRWWKLWACLCRQVCQLLPCRCNGFTACRCGVSYWGLERVSCSCSCFAGVWLAGVRLAVTSVK